MRFSWKKAKKMANQNQVLVSDGTNVTWVDTMREIHWKDWENFTADQIMSSFPAGTSYDVVFRILVLQVSHLSKKVKDLEDSVVDKILLDPKV